MPLRRRDGRFFGTLCALDPAAAALPEEHLGLFGLIADLIAYQLEAEELHDARGRALLEAETAIMFRERFVGILGHDLRNPLSAITMGSQLLLTRDELPPKHVAIVRRIVRSATRMEEIISAVLDAVRGRFGALQVRPAPCDASALVRQVVDELAVVHPERTIEVDAPALLSATWDAPRVAQLVSNLLGNAIQHSPPDSVVRVTMRGLDGWARIELANVGATIAADALRDLFEPFRRGPDARERTGLGLGLFIARSIAAAHGGTIDVMSADKVTTFVVRMPT